MNKVIQVFILVILSVSADASIKDDVVSLVEENASEVGVNLPSSFYDEMNRLIGMHQSLETSIDATRAHRQWTDAEKNELVNRINSYRESILVDSRQVRLAYPLLNDVWLEFYGDILSSTLTNRSNALSVYFTAIKCGLYSSGINLKIASILDVMILNSPEVGTTITDTMRQHFLLPPDASIVEEEHIEQLHHYKNLIVAENWSKELSSLSQSENYKMLCYRYSEMLKREMSQVSANAKKLEQESAMRLREMQRRLNYDSAVNEFRDFIDSNPDGFQEVETVLLQVDKLQKHRRYILRENIERIPFYNLMDDSFPGQGVAELYQYYFRYAIYRDYEKIKESLEADDLTNENVPRLFLLFFVSDKLNFYDDATSALSKILDIDPDNRVALSYKQSYEKRSR
jgi:tetratricopeptide (TPR) repeat protein